MDSGYGEHKTATILNNTGSVLLFGGTRDQADLQFWSTLAGERDERITTTDLHGRVASRTVRKVPVLAPAQIANLPAGKVVVYRRGISPVIGRARMAWTRRDVRAQHATAPLTGWRGRCRRAQAWVEVGLGALWCRATTPRTTTPGTTEAPPARPEPRSGRVPLVIDVEPVVDPVIGEHRSGSRDGSWRR